jgi:hypothetical protein
MAGPGLRAFPALWFGPYGSTTANPVVPGSGGPGLRSFQSLWFGPDGSAGVGAVTPAVTSGRKLISPQLSATIHGELT